MHAALLLLALALVVRGVALWLRGLRFVGGPLGGVRVVRPAWRGSRRRRVSASALLRRSRRRWRWGLRVRRVVRALVPGVGVSRPWPWWSRWVLRRLWV